MSLLRTHDDKHTEEDEDERRARGKARRRDGDEKRMQGGQVGSTLNKAAEGFKPHNQHRG